MSHCRSNDYDLSTLPEALLESVPMQLRDAEGPVFLEPWQAQIFATTVALHERGVFTWPEWAAALAAEIKAAQAAGDRDLGDTYYNHWLAALERLVLAKGISSEKALADCAASWDRAARATPHGMPIELGNDQRHFQSHGHP